jgi:hypothetical protein
MHAGPYVCSGMFEELETESLLNLSTRLQKKI